jgi:hypothetical protein
MRAFQRTAKEELEGVAATHGIALAFDVVPVQPCAAIGHEEGDVYLRTEFENDGQAFQVYLYTDEGSVSFNGDGPVFELPDYRNDESRLRSALVSFVRRCLESQDRWQALAEVQRQWG